MKTIFLTFFILASSGILMKTSKIISYPPEFILTLVVCFALFSYL